jgi:hypothetical protein
MRNVTQLLFLTIFVGNVVAVFTVANIYMAGFSLFVAGCSGAILVGGVLKYYSQAEIDRREIRSETQKMRKKGCASRKK